VQRLPNKIIYPLFGWQAFVVIITSLITGDPSSGWRAVGGPLIAFTGFAGEPPSRAGPHDSIPSA
jgi:hypothetical protein